MTWSGVFPAVTTKLAIDGSVDLKATQANYRKLGAEG